MKKWLALGILISAPALLFAPACHDAHREPPPTVFYVDAVYGNDGSEGTFSEPFKTVTHALTVVVSGKAVKLAPGTYDAANGEVFPLVVPAGVSLIGDESSKGAGAAPTVVRGGALLGATTLEPVIDAGAGAVIAGLTITNDNASLVTPIGVTAGADGINLRNNTWFGTVGGGSGTGVAVYVHNGSQNHVVSGNLIDSNVGIGLHFAGGGAGSRIENNVITNNVTGVRVETDGVDLGGGAAGSAGGNTFSCNTGNDLWTNLPAVVTLSAQNNLWDHVPPSATDIVTTGGATIDTTGAAVAPSFCP